MRKPSQKQQKIHPKQKRSGYQQKEEKFCNFDLGELQIYHRQHQTWAPGGPTDQVHRRKRLIKFAVVATPDLAATAFADLTATRTLETANPGDLTNPAPQPIRSRKEGLKNFRSRIRWVSEEVSACIG
ncbi:unnamed protein product [Cuscuta europaea]|uniref:Uncharacterized protein n=1 Tax=Cuscuta europaea TaxID=41803 RepID=A0A9P0ZWP7_CUSEU|nr:unnamed protein product [Cuscuta europaea]